MSHGLAHADAGAPRAPALLWLWCLYPLLVPFYLLGKTPVPGTQRLASGVPQVADYYFAAFMSLVCLCLPLRLPRATRPVVGAVALFVVYTGLINFIWAAYLENLSLLMNSLFYVYDGLLFATCLLLYQRYGDRFLRATVYAVAASVIVQALLSPLALDHNLDRQALFFNDENQLGYFCLLAATIVGLGSRRFAIPLVCQAVFWVAIGYLSILSQCRGALAGLAILAVVMVLEHPLRLLAVLGAFVVGYGLLTTEPAVIAKSEERLVRAGEYDSPETRGYDRIANHPEHILFGAGEGAYDRFRSALWGTEIHSSYGTLLFCYGLIGTGLFGAALGWIAWGDPRSSLFLIPAFVYGSAHHGVRGAFFWTMLAVLCCIALNPRPGAEHNSGSEEARHG
jgi:hypothetical protein